MRPVSTEKDELLLEPETKYSISIMHPLVSQLIFALSYNKGGSKQMNDNLAAGSDIMLDIFNFTCVVLLQ